MKTVISYQLSVIRKRIAERNRSLIVSSTLCVLVFCFLSVTLVAVAFGAEGGEAHESVFKAYRWQVLNFAVLVAVLIFLVKKADLKGALRRRTELIEKSLKEAKEAKELAEKALAEVEERLKLKDKEIEEILSRTRLSAEKEKELLIRQGEEMKAKVLEQAKNNIDYELRQAKETIKAEAVKVAMELAEKKLKDKLTKEEQLRLIEESLKRMESKN